MTFHQIHTGKDYYKYSIFPLAIVQSNALQANVAVAPSLEIFKAILNFYLYPDSLQFIHILFFFIALMPAACQKSRKGVSSTTR